ncbi:MAG TPA: hypothetical protein VI583_15425 [Cyclobacteriaceae bacterium]|nr:hypothetical protein [Cyclobacteriaceae bacterium]
MDLMKEMLAGNSKLHAVRVARLIGDYPGLMDELIKLVTSENQDFARKAAWVLRSCYELDRNCLKPHLPRLIKFIYKEKIHDAVKRNILGILKTSEIPRKYSGKLLEKCFQFIRSGRESIAVKAFSMDIINCLAEGDPYILRELCLIIEDQLPYASAGIISKSRIILSKRQEK